MFVLENEYRQEIFSSYDLIVVCNMLNSIIEKDIANTGVIPKNKYLIAKYENADDEGIVIYEV